MSPLGIGPGQLVCGQPGPAVLDGQGFGKVGWVRLSWTERIGQAVRTFRSWMRAWWLVLHAEPRAPHGFDRRSRPAHLDLCRALPAEQVEQQLARRSGDAGGRFPPPCPDGLSGPRPLELKTCAAQPPREEPGRAAEVAPQGLIHGLLVRPGTTAVGSAYVLVVDEELIEAREPAHPSDAEEARRRSRPDRRNQPGEVPQRERSSSPFRQAAPRTGQDKPGASQVVALAQDQVRGQIAGRPPREESRRPGTQFVEQVAELCSLDGVEEQTGHIAAV